MFSRTNRLLAISTALSSTLSLIIIVMTIVHHFMVLEKLDSIKKS